MGEKASANPPITIWKNIGIRFVSAVAFSAVCIAPFYFGGWIWAILVAIMGTRMIYEWVRMSDKSATSLAYAIPIVGFLICILYALQLLPLHVFAAFAVTIGLAALERVRRGGAGWAALGVVYIVGASLLIIALRGNETGFDTVGFQLLFFIILVVVGADVGAYMGGSYFKGPKLSPKLSPNKTWSGFLTGLAFALLIAALFALVIGMSPWIGMALGFPLVILSVLGDLFESGIKRKLNVKDTGGLLPGHGGLLDRLDSLMAAVAGAAAILFLFPNIWGA
ncbi:phosphatidate cytidylyltransferase [Litorimonas sp. RW-G-Af-16]|uniref:phosphatidate cytidylyltransferase n=1 Tax=Litorimonas sp. RW-G-Af-16 TaxID=3241168 RepID=UPI00390C825F